MSDMAAKHSTPDDPMTSGQWWLAVCAAVLMLGLAGLAFRGMFSSVRDEMVPFFGGIAWIVPVGVDLGIVILVLAGILLEWLAMPMPALRLIAGFFMGCTMWLNADAAHGQPAGIVGHLSLPVLFIACVEAVRHAVRRRSGLAAGTVREGVPLARWLLAPASTLGLWRRMVLWQETSYATALTREQVRRKAIARLRAAHGAGWRQEADSAVVWQLARGIDVEAAAALVPRPLPSVPGSASAASPRPGPEARPGARPEARPAPALKLTAGKSRSMSPAELEPHVSAMLDAYGTVSQARVKRDLHVATDKAAEALRLARSKRVVVAIGKRSG